MKINVSTLERVPLTSADIPGSIATVYGRIDRALTRERRRRKHVEPVSDEALQLHRIVAGHCLMSRLAEIRFGVKGNIDRESTERVSDSELLREPLKSEGALSSYRHAVLTDATLNVFGRSVSEPEGTQGSDYFTADFGGYVLSTGDLLVKYRMPLAGNEGYNPYPDADNNTYRELFGTSDDAPSDDISIANLCTIRPDGDVTMLRGFNPLLFGCDVTGIFHRGLEQSGQDTRSIEFNVGNHLLKEILE